MHNLDYSQPDLGIDDAVRFGLVSSFYGPGALVCWLLTAASAIITWGFHSTLKRKKTFGSDFFAAALYPSVSAGHLLYQIATFPGNRKTMFTTIDPALVPRTAAIEAALNICETGSLLALAFCAVAGWRGVERRFYSAVVGGLVVFSSYCTAFFLAGDLHISQSQLSRPYLFNVRPLVIAILSAVGTVVVFLVLVLLALKLGLVGLPSASQREQSKHEANIRGLGAQRDQALRANDYDRAAKLEAQINSAKFAKDSSRDAFVVNMSFWITICFLPLSFISTFFGATIPQAQNSVNGHGWNWQLLYFIPRSNVSILELDQIVAVAGGVITLLLGIRSAYRAHQAEHLVE